MGSQRVGHDWAANTFSTLHWGENGICYFLFSSFTAVLLRPNWLFCNRKDHFPYVSFPWWVHHRRTVVICAPGYMWSLFKLLPPKYLFFFFFFPQISILNILPQESFSWGLEFLEHTVILCLTLRKCWTVCTVAELFYIPTSGVWGFYFIHIFSDIGYFLFFWF